MTKEEYLLVQDRLFDLYQTLSIDELPAVAMDRFELHNPARDAAQIAETGPLRIEMTMLTATSKDFVRSIFNLVNRFRHAVHLLKCWERLLDEVSIDLKLSLLFGTVDAITEGALSTPYILKNRLIYCTVQLLHEAARNVMPEWYKQTLNERGIDRKSLVKGPQQVAETLKVDISSLLNAIDVLNSGQISENRNQLTHRLPSNIEVGLSTTFTRSQRGGSVAYGISSEDDSLKVSDAVSLLVLELNTAVQAANTFRNFCGDVEEILGSWRFKRNAFTGIYK